MKMNNRRILFLDYMRVIAFSLVVLGHKFNKDLSSWANDLGNHVTLRWFYGLLADASFGGAMGVVIFFLVSGYIITHVLQKEATFEFYLKRIFRIYPLYIFAVIAEILINHYNGSVIPPLSILIPRLLLIGDFFNTPLSLAGVEWTLRIEMVFYVFMGLVKKVGLINKGNALAVLLLVVSLFISNINPFPVAKDFHNAYFTLYTPFLFIGVVVYLSEHKLVNKGIALISVVTLFYLHLSLIEKINPSWGQYNYAFTGTVIFLGSWLYRDKFVESKACNLLSEMTYCVYLFHNWIWYFLSLIVVKIDLPYINNNIQILALLFIICYIAHKTIERRCVLIGKTILRKVLI
ncbi:acyltransferase family protein [Trabulsiella odontotermitis]|uniref:acyltransferase family protein n=1 Tax=Trabulsiella odontotermitis TaxID=379893 RepID=UPI003AD3D38A